jgi:hypothetical protein
MARLFLTLLALAPAFPVAAYAWADEQTAKVDQAVVLSAANAGPEVQIQNAVDATLARFDKNDPGWKVRMKALVEMAKVGPKAVPVLVEALKTGSPSTREFAAQALVLFPDSSNRPALEEALAHPNPQVRFYAIQALSMLGVLPPSDLHQRILTSDPSTFGVRPMMATALTPGDRPSAVELRKALADYNLHSMYSARIGGIAPDFTLLDFTGKTYRLSQFRGKKTVVLRFILYDY